MEVATSKGQEEQSKGEKQQHLYKVGGEEFAGLRRRR